MCVIAICPPKLRPAMKTVQACWDANPHGAGIAWRDRDQVRWIKTNDPQEIYERAQKLPGEIVLHFRIASIGGVCDALRHPFPVSRRAGLADRGSAKAVLFQNGTWSRYREALDFAEDDGYTIPHGEMSDSRAAAFLVSIYGHEFLKKCTPSRWVYFSAKQTALYGSWHNYRGLNYSNMGWRSYLPDERPRSRFSDVHDAVDRAYRDRRMPMPVEVRDQLDLWSQNSTEDYWSSIKRRTTGKVLTYGNPR